MVRLTQQSKENSKENVSCKQSGKVVDVWPARRSTPTVS